MRAARPILGGIVNWKEWLTQVTSGVVASVIVLALAATAGSIWPSVKQWTLGHQNLVYAFLALVVGVTIGRFSHLRKTPSDSQSAGVRLDRVANLFWLGSDIQWARQMSNLGFRDKLAHGLQQSYH